MRFKKYICFFVLTPLLVILFTRCAKDEYVEEDPTNGGGSTTTSSFTWTLNNTSSQFANDYFFVSAFNNIVGKNTGNGSYVDITLDNLDPGAYTISASKGIILDYYDGSKSYRGVSGVVNISAKTGTLLSGNFTASFYTGTITSISGQFIEIPEK
jgi:hypothetical protein